MTPSGGDPEEHFGWVVALRFPGNQSTTVGTRNSAIQ